MTSAPVDPGDPEVGPTVAPVPTAPLDGPVVNALQAALAGEHAVVWAYGVLGPRLNDNQQVTARAVLVEHGRSRDRLRTILVGAGAVPVAAEPAYDLPVDPVDAVRGLQLAALLEERLAAVYADLVAATGVTGGPALRTLAVTALVDAARRTAGWRGSAPTFPGLPEEPDA